MNLISASTLSQSSFTVGIPFQASEILSKKKAPFFVAISDFTEYLHWVRAGFTRLPASDGPSAPHSDFVTDASSAGNPSNLNPATYIPSLSPELSDYLMGKSPLRLVVKRREFTFCPYPEKDPDHFITQWKETLECGHKQIASCYTTPLVIPTAKRRRCQECKGQQPLLYRPYTPLPLKKDCLTLRVVDYLNWAQDNEERVHLRDDIAIARLAVILAGQGDPEPWRWAFIRLLGGSPEKLIPIFVARMNAHLKMELPPKKPSTSTILESYPARRKYSKFGFDSKREEEG